ncbi:hypothetical protein V1478_010835 [Vespula squamosa]|uniref:Uncharacterized protein n=1 Tax=Vespula squamosa TaxID=30214 RepID=A0ABD2AFG4_VESSQ
MQLLSWAFTYNAWTPQIGKGFMRSCTTLDKSTKAGRDDALAFECLPEQLRETLAGAVLILDASAELWNNSGGTPVVAAVAAVAAAAAAAAASPPPAAVPPTPPDQPLTDIVNEI